MYQPSNREEPPPAYGTAVMDNTPVTPPPPYNPSFMGRVGGTLRSAATGVEEFFLSQEYTPEHNRVGTLPRRNQYEIIPQDDSRSPPTRTRGRERVQRRAREFANTMTLRGNRSRNRRRPARRTDSPTRQEVMESLPTFWPICTVLITAIQLILFIAVCVAFGLAPISISSETERSACLPKDFASTICAYEQKEVLPNFFIGPPSDALIHVGAQFTPCMRDNVAFLVEAAKERNNELNLRCCHAFTCGYDSCGMISLDSCLDNEAYRGCTEILGGASVCRNESLSPNQCGNVTVHPCCVGILGKCILTTQENCSFQNGYYHPELAVCSDIGDGCFNDICSFTWSSDLNNHQGVRFIFAMFLHRGVIDLLIVLLAQIYISGRIERRIGWLRLILIYLLSGVGGFLLSGIFVPRTVSVGASGPLFGLLGVQLVELIQGWKWIHKPCTELIKLIIFDVILLALGLLPYIDNYANIGGFIFGVLSAFVLVPYITVGKWDRVKKLCIILIALPIIAFLYLVGFVVFYNLPDSNFCSWCSYIDCIPFTDTFCDDLIGTVTSFVPVVPPNTA